MSDAKILLLAIAMIMILVIWVGMSIGAESEPPEEVSWLDSCQNSCVEHYGVNNAYYIQCAALCNTYYYEELEGE